MIEYESDEVVKLSMQLRFSGDVRQVIQTDEDRFMENEKAKVIALGADGERRTLRGTEARVS